MFRVPYAAEFHQVAVHMEYALTAGPLVQVVDVLGHEQEAVPQALFEFGERNVGCVRLVLGEALA